MNLDAFHLDADFPGGNILLETIKGDSVFLRQELRDTDGDWFYWAFRVRGAAGRRLTFYFTGSDVLADRGPAISLDGRQSWQWLGADGVGRNDQADGGWSVAFSYDFPQTAAEVYFALCPLYTQSNLDAFLAGKTGDSIYPEVKALRERASTWANDGSKTIVLDLHCPWVRGERNEVLYFVGGPNEAIWRHVKEFSQVLENTCSGPLAFRERDNLPFGKEWNVLSSCEIGLGSCRRGVVACRTSFFPPRSKSLMPPLVKLKSRSQAAGRWAVI